MNIFKKATVGLVLSLAIGTMTQAAWAGKVGEREENQHDRIDAGVQSGQLTAAETNRLDKRETKIESDRQKALADGKMTHKEKAKLIHEENRASKKIFKLKHNNKKA